MEARTSKAIRSDKSLTAGANQRARTLSDPDLLYLNASEDASPADGALLFQLSEEDTLDAQFAEAARVIFYVGNHSINKYWSDSSDET